MAISLGDIFIALRANSSGLKGDLDDAKRSTTSWAKTLGGNVSKFVGGAVVAGVGAAAAGIVGLGKAALDMQGDFKTATDALINGTGASGKALADMELSVRSLKASAAGLNTDFSTIGATMAEVNTRTGLTGDGLESLTGQILQFTRLAGGDAVSNTQLLTRVMGDWGVQNEDAAGLLDQLYGAGQAFGIGFDNLAAKVVQFGAPLRQMGFSLEQSIAMFGKWEKEGVNAELVVGSLRIAAGKFANENIDLAEGLQDTMERIKGAATESEGLSIAMEVFGARAGPDMAAAIREGRFELDDAIAALRATSGGLDDAAARTIGFREKWQIAMAGLKDNLIPLGDTLSKGIDLFAPYVESALATVTEKIQAFTANSNFEWTPEFKQIKLGDLFEFVKSDALGLTTIKIAEWFDMTLGTNLTKFSLGDFFSFVKDDGTGVTKVKISDWFDFTSWEGMTKFSIGDFFTFTSDTKKTEINLADYIVVGYDKEGLYKLKLGSLYEIDKTEKKKTVKIFDIIEIKTDAETGKTIVDLSTLLEFDKSKLGTFTLSDFVPFIGETETYDLATIFTFDKSLITGFSVSDLITFIPETGAYDIGGIFTFDKSKIGTVTLGNIFPFLGEDLKFKISDMLTVGSEFPIVKVSDLLSFLDAEGLFDLSKSFTFDATKIGTVSLSNIFPFMDSETNLFNALDAFTFDATKIGTVSLSNIFPFLDSKTNLFNVLDAFTFDAASMGTVTLAEIFPFLSEEGTYDLSTLFTAGEGPGYTLSDLFNFGEGAKLEGPDWATILPVFTWSDRIDKLDWGTYVKEPTWKTWISDLLWSTYVKLMKWDDWLTKLDWASYVSPITWASWLVKIDWKKLVAPFPAWSTVINDIQWPTIPAFPGWQSLMNLFGGGGDSNGSIRPNTAYDPPVEETITDASVGGFNDAGPAVIVNFYNTVVSKDVDIEALAYRVGQRIAYAT